MEVTIDLKHEGWDIETHWTKNHPEQVTLKLGDNWGTVEVTGGYPVLLNLAADIISTCPPEALPLRTDITANAPTGEDLATDCIRALFDLLGDEQMLAKVQEERAQREGQRAHRA